MCSRHNILLFEADHRCLSSGSVVSVQPELNSDVVKALGLFLDSLKSNNYNCKNMRIVVLCSFSLSLSTLYFEVVADSQAIAKI